MIFVIILIIYNLAASLGVITLYVLIEKIENGTQFFGYSFKSLTVKSIKGKIHCEIFLSERFMKY